MNELLSFQLMDCGGDANAYDYTIHSYSCKIPFTMNLLDRRLMWKNHLLLCALFTIVFFFIYEGKCCTGFIHQISN